MWTADIEDLAGLTAQPNRWLILGIDVSGVSDGGPPRWKVHVYAVDLKRVDVTTIDDLNVAATGWEGVPTVDIELHDVGLDDVARCMRLLHIHIRNPYLNHQLMRAGYADVPDQG